MVVIGRGTGINSDNISFFTSNDIPSALSMVSENSTKFAIELFVDFAELKHYKEKYEEIYSKLFKEYTGEEQKSKASIYKDILFSVKSMDEDEKVNFNTFHSCKEALDYIEEESTSQETFSAQLLVNLSEVQDYKEKYDEFYSLMLDSYKEKRTKQIKAEL